MASHKTDYGPKSTKRHRRQNQRSSAPQGISAYTLVALKHIFRAALNFHLAVHQATAVFGD